MGIFCLIILYTLWKKMNIPVVYFSDIATKISQGNLEVEIPHQKSLEKHPLTTSLQRLLCYIKEREKAYQELDKKIHELQKNPLPALEHIEEDR